MRTHATSCLAFGLAAALAVQGAVTLDRIAVIVGKHVIKTSDIDRDIRLTAFLNQQKSSFASQTKRQSAERLIDQEIIRQEIATGSYKRPSEADALAFQTQIVRERFGGSEAALNRALSQDGLTREQLATHLLWQLTVLRFIDQRFRLGVFVSDDEVQQYVQQHKAALQKQNLGAGDEALNAKAREILEGERVNQNFDQWLAQARMRVRIEYKQEAFA
jgi:hypothetical protein